MNNLINLSYVANLSLIFDKKQYSIVSSVPIWLQTSKVWYMVSGFSKIDSFEYYLSTFLS